MLYSHLVFRSPEPKCIIVNSHSAHRIQYQFLYDRPQFSCSEDAHAKLQCPRIRSGKYPSGSNTDGDVVVLINTDLQIIMALKIARDRRFTILMKAVSWLTKK